MFDVRLYMNYFLDSVKLLEELENQLKQEQSYENLTDTSLYKLSVLKWWVEDMKSVLNYVEKKLEITC